MNNRLYKELINDISKTIKKSLHENISLLNNDIKESLFDNNDTVNILNTDSVLDDYINCYSSDNPEDILSKITENITEIDKSRTNGFLYNTSCIYNKCKDNIKEYLHYLYKKSNGISDTDKFNNFIKLFRNFCLKVKKLYNIDPYYYIERNVDFEFSIYTKHDFDAEYTLKINMDLNDPDYSYINKYSGFSDRPTYITKYYEIKGSLQTLKIQIEDLNNTYYMLPDFLEYFSISFSKCIIIPYLKNIKFNNKKLVESLVDNEVSNDILDTDSVLDDYINDSPEEIFNKFQEIYDINYISDLSIHTNNLDTEGLLLLKLNKFFGFKNFGKPRLNLLQTPYDGIEEIWMKDGIKRLSLKIIKNAKSNTYYFDKYSYFYNGLEKYSDLNDIEKELLLDFFQYAIVHKDEFIK